MTGRRVIVGVGEALLAEEGDREVPCGLGLLVPIYAVLLGHEGIAISRLGQDAPASALLSRLRELGCVVTHLQSDPDLATGRVRRNARGGRTTFNGTSTLRTWRSAPTPWSSAA